VNQLFDILVDNLDKDIRTNDIVNHVIEAAKRGDNDVAIKRFIITNLMGYDKKLLTTLNNGYNEETAMHGAMSHTRFLEWVSAVQENMDKQDGILYKEFDASNAKQIVTEFNKKNKKLYVMGVYLYHKGPVNSVISTHDPHLTGATTVGVN
jgi:hypothetical protein